MPYTTKSKEKKLLYKDRLTIFSMGIVVVGFYAIQWQSSAIYTFLPAALNPLFGCLMRTCRVPPSPSLLQRAAAFWLQSQRRPSLQRHQTGKIAFPSHTSKSSTNTKSNYMCCHNTLAKWRKCISRTCGDHNDASHFSFPHYHWSIPEPAKSIHHILPLLIACALLSSCIFFIFVIAITIIVVLAALFGTRWHLLTCMQSNAIIMSNGTSTGIFCAIQSAIGMYLHQG